MKKGAAFLLICSMVLATTCCGGMYTKKNPSSPHVIPWGNITITKDAFIFGSDYPPDMVIPDIDGMRDIAFVVSCSAPSGVLAIDLEANPLALSSKFAGLISPAGTGMPNSLHILNADRAMLLTSSHLITFNPTTGTVNSTINLLDELELDRYVPISSTFDVDNDGTAENAIKTINMSYPGGMAVAGDKLYVTMSNLLSPLTPAVAAPGVVRIFDIVEYYPFLVENRKPIIATDFNPTAITPLPDGLLAITNSGVSDIWDDSAHPLTNSSIDFLKPEIDEIVDNLPLGRASLSFQEMATTSDGNTAFIGSATFGEVYAINPITREAVNTHGDPITITGNGEGSDYLSSLVLSYDDWYLFVASFDNSSIYPVDVSTTPPVVLPTTFKEPFILGFPKGVTPENPTGTNTGVGAIAVRPGIPGIDYNGPDLFALTGNPGTLVTINTHGSGQGNSLPIKSMEILPKTLRINGTSESLQLHLSARFANRITNNNITDTLTNPFSGHPVKVRWSSSNTDVATISSAALVTPKSLGQSTITAKIGQRSAQASVVVSPGEEDTLSAQPSQQPAPAEKEEEMEILSRAPEGTDPFADRVIKLNPGPGAGFGSANMPNVVLGGPVGGGKMMGSLDVVSLGFKGEIILEMTDFIIADGPGPDFTVFENAFYAGGNPNNPFSEPGIVSVSEDGEIFVEFSCDIGNRPHYPGCGGTQPSYSTPDNGIDPTDPDVSGGNQFDLADLGLTAVRFVRIVDGGVSGSIGSSAGFDLDAVAVINGTLP